MRAANGTGIISTTVLESDDLDEIDWVSFRPLDDISELNHSNFEQEQISTYDDSIQTNYFGKGNTTSYDRDTTVNVTTPEETFHTYTVDWTSSRIEWILDGEVVRTLEYADALNGDNYPQTPMRIKIGIWAGGDSDNSEGTIEWAGGETDYTAGPFTMYVESVKVINYNPASAYKYTDKTGAYTSIKATNGTTSTNLASTSSSVKAASSSSGSASSASSSASASASASYSAAGAIVPYSAFGTFVAALIASIFLL
jgi:beta-glucanase (GH16 family)